MKKKKSNIKELSLYDRIYALETRLKGLEVKLTPFLEELESISMDTSDLVDILDNARLGDFR